MMNAPDLSAQPHTSIALARGLATAARRPPRPGGSDEPPQHDSKQIFLAAIERKAELVKAGIQAGQDGPGWKEDPKELVLTGMGGSGLAGMLVQDVADRFLDIPVRLVRDYRLPHNIGTGAHVLAISHSGATEETLAVVDQALERGLPVTAFTTGGELAERVQSVIRQPDDLPPRMALPHVWGSLLGHLSLVQPELELPLHEIDDSVRSMNERCRTTIVEEDNPAKILASALSERVPQVYVTPALQAVGYFFVCQLNENAKRIAHLATVPESNHNALTAWSEDPKRTLYAAVAAYEEDETCMGRIEYMRRRHDDWGIPWYGFPTDPIDTAADHVAAQVGAMQFFDYVAYYTTVLHGVDPADIREVDSLKRHLRGTASSLINEPARSPA